VLYVGSDPEREGRGSSFKFWDPFLSSERLELETGNFACIYRGGGPNENYVHLDHRGRRRGYVT